MKKNYERMEAYKVEFNANEQVAAAVCNYNTGNGQYKSANSSASGSECDHIDSTKGDSKIVNITSPDAFCVQAGGGYTMQYV